MRKKARLIDETGLKRFLGFDAALHSKDDGCKSLEYRDGMGFYLGDHRVSNNRIVWICEQGFGSPATRYKTAFVSGGLIE